MAWMELAWMELARIELAWMELARIELAWMELARTELARMELATGPLMMAPPLSPRQKSLHSNKLRILRLVVYSNCQSRYQNN